MGKLKFIDRDGYKICRQCEIEFEASRTFYHTNNRNPDRLSCICKTCDNSNRTIRQKTRASHNVPRRCIECDSFFYASRADMNKCKRNTGQEGGYFCSRKCQYKNISNHSCGMIGKSWNGQRQGINNPNAKHSEDTIKQVKILLQQGMRARDIARKININESYISHIKTGRTWASLVV